MYGLTRGTITLLGAAVAGVLVWLATQVDQGTTGGYWSVYGLLAAAGLTMAFSQILGGWTKWGWPRLSLNVFLLAFVPVLIAAGWVIVGAQPHGNWFRDHVRSWSDDISIGGLVRDLTQYASVLGFGIGLVFGFTFDTTGPSAYGPFGRRRRAASIPAGGAAPAAPPPQERGSNGDVADEREPATAGAPADVSSSPPTSSETSSRGVRPSGEG
jgi:hypothetical protein